MRHTITFLLLLVSLITIVATTGQSLRLARNIMRAAPTHLTPQGTISLAHRKALIDSLTNQ